MSTAAAPTFVTIPLTSITPNPNNPRKSFDDAKLKELAQSISDHGVRQPVLVRPGKKDGDYLLVCGERRWRASKMAGAASIPAIVDFNLDDRGALEVSILENLHRADVHPLDEALGYKALMDMQDKSGKPGDITVESIAAKVGKSIGYVYARMKLLALIPAGREAFQSDRITAGHAVLIARLVPSDQVKAIAACFHEWFDDREFKDHDPMTIKLKMILDDDFLGLLPEKALREWIQDNVNLKLKGVPWDLDSADLVPGAGACTNCPKRSASNPALFSELAIKGEDTCFDAACYKSKREAFVKIQIQADKDHERAARTIAKQTGDEIDHLPLLQLSDLVAYTKAKPDQAVYRVNQWMPAARGSCNSVQDGIMVRGEQAGQRKLVCVDIKCKVHKHELASHSLGGGGSVITRVDPAVRAAQDKLEDDSIVRLLSLAMGKIKKVDVKTLRMIADGLVTGAWGLDFVLQPLGLPVSPKDGPIRIDTDRAKLFKFIKSASLLELVRLIFLVCMAEDLTDYSPEIKTLQKMAGTDLKKIQAQLTKEAKSAKPKAKAAAASKGDK